MFKFGTIFIRNLSQIPKVNNKIDKSAALTDAFGRFHNYLRISLTEKCNLRSRLRTFSTLTHIDAHGNAAMVDVSDKSVTRRTATARATVHVGAAVAHQIRTHTLAKGNVLNVSQLAGIAAAKKTSELIPLCHNLPLNKVQVDAQLVDDDAEGVVEITATVSCSARTGVEMEALCAASVAALTVYDMCKAVNKEMCIGDVRLVHKSGGRSGEFVYRGRHAQRHDVTVKEYDKSPMGKDDSPFVGSF